jgi:hypothetical protein
MNVLLDLFLDTPFTAVDPNLAGGEPGVPARLDGRDARPSI